MELNLFKALVENTDDPDKQGKIKIRVLPEMEKLESELLPWAIPFSNECSSKTLQSKLPEKGSTIRVLIDKYWKRFYYLSNPYFYGLFDYSKIENSIKNVKDAQGSDLDITYNNIEFNLYEDGGLDFHNRKDGSHGFIHKSGSYALFDKDGSTKVSNNKCLLSLNKSGGIVVESPNQPISLDNKKSKILLDKNGEITIESVGQTLTLSNTISTLGGLLEELINDLSTLTTEGTAVSQTSPTLTAQMAVLLPKVKALLK